MGVKRNSDLEVCYGNVQPKLRKLRISIRNQSFLQYRWNQRSCNQRWAPLEKLTLEMGTPFDHRVKVLKSQPDFRLVLYCNLRPWSTGGPTSNHQLTFHQLRGPTSRHQLIVHRQGGPPLEIINLCSKRGAHLQKSSTYLVKSGPPLDINSQYIDRGAHLQISSTYLSRGGPPLEIINLCSKRGAHLQKSSTYLVAHLQS